MSGEVPVVRRALRLTSGHEANSYGRERLRPNRGFPADLGRRNEPTRMTCRGERNERFIDGSVFGYGAPLGSSGCCICSGSFVGVHAFSRIGQETPVRTEPLPPIRRAVACSEQALSDA
jgi:hypothetical protein